VREKHLHIVTHDVPYPADFGGVVDVFYKIKWLYQVGVKIHLHCFVNKRPAQTELNKYCETVTYYKRKGFLSFSLTTPYIVSSRSSNVLLQNLQKDNYPILFEGVHCTYHVSINALATRQIFLRLFNVEHVYYEHLAKNENNLFKKLYYKIEARLLKKYENKIANYLHIFTFSMQDTKTYQQLFNAKEIHFLPAFLPYDYLKTKFGKGSYCLYQANLNVNENEKAALWLMEHVFNTLTIPLIIAGKNPSEKLKLVAKKYNHISIVESPTDENMQLLITNAQINILPSFNNTGVKLKLLNALYNGRHCLVNLAGVNGSGLNELCNIAETEVEFQKEIIFLFDKPFADTAAHRRNIVLKNIYNNETNAIVIKSAIVST
jgi:glycosyltransferase involved in cell wall biosynthesis